MYDGTDVALVLGGLLSAGGAGISLICALIALGLFVGHKARKDTSESLAGKWGVIFVAAAIVCGMSIPCGMAVYNMFDHQRGVSNPPSHVLAVAMAFAWGPIAAISVAFAWLPRRT